MLAIGCLVLVLFGFSAAKPYAAPKSACGYESCPEVYSGALNVHVVPHSHDDVGWLKTVDQYYYGTKRNIQYAGVQYIISSVITALKANPKRRFIQVETAFFKMWWDNQDDRTKEVVKELVNNGQLEIAGGAWSMNDEAAAHYHSTVDQFTLGLRFMNDTFGECGRPKVAWQIDPFGHSREMASIFAQNGFDGLFFSRLDYRDKSKRQSEKTMDLIWRGSANLDGSDLFTSVLYNHYSAPSGFCFDVKCSDTPIIDDINDPDYNYEKKVEDYAAFIRQQAQNYPTNHILITMGDDFMYQDANEYFTNMDKLIDGFQLFPQTNGNDRIPINVFYSTPGCYVKAVNEEVLQRSLSLSVKTDDFFPYASGSEAYWTGYFTSRPNSKRFERQSSNLLQVAKQLAVFNGEASDDLNPLREAVGIMQHHDAITGTEKQAVANDYHRILYKANELAVESSNERILKLIGADDSFGINFSTCFLANMSYCPETNSDRFLLTVYNPLSRPVSHYVHLPVNSAEFDITDENGNAVNYQITIPITNFNYTGWDLSKYILVFKAADLPPLGYKIYEFINKHIEDYEVPIDVSDTKFVIGDSTNGAELDDQTGKVAFITLRGESLKIHNTLDVYYSSNWDQRRASGAYVFQPYPDFAQGFREVVPIQTIRGDLFDEVHQVYSDWAKQVVRVYKDESYIEFDWIVGPIPTDDHGNEVINKFSTGIATESDFYTDANGREMIKRIRNYRETYNYTNEEPTTANYYPVTSKITLRNEDSNIQFSVLNDRAQGGSSLSSGEVELMIHRACTNDDGFGVGETLNEKAFGEGILARGQHYVTFSSIKTAGAIEKDIAQRKLLAPWIFISPVDGEIPAINREFTGLKGSLPDHIQILTLESIDTNKIILRLEHILEKSEIEDSSPTIVDLKELFANFQVTSLRETTLAANQWLEDSERLSWNVTENVAKTKDKRVDGDDLDNLIVALTPMQIRTFIATVSQS